MANSLIELYGGGMAGKSNNYQLGGRIAGAKRRRDYQGELRGLRKKQEEANRRKKKSGMLGTLGSIAGGTIGFMLGGPGGAAIGAGLGRGAGESSYAREDYGGGKYAQETRGDLRQAEDDYRSAIGEKMIVDAAKAYFMPGMYEGLSKGITTGAGKIGAAFGEAQTSAELFGLGEGVKTFGKELGTQFGGNMPMEMLAAPPTGYTPTPDVASVVSPPAPTTPPVDLSFSDAFQQAASQGGVGSTFDWRGNPYVVEYSNTPTQFAGFRGGGLIGMTMPRYENGGMVGGQFYKDPRGEAVNPYPPTTQPPTTQPQNPYVPPTPIPAPYTPGYGTATDTTGALRQMGMAGVALDPRLQQYMGDLPDFQMGYAQQIGDIYTGARQAARGMRGQESIAAGQRGFSGSGIGQRETRQSFGDLRTDVARQRRGVVEGYQADLLSAIGDIEQKGEFEFGTSPEAMGARVKDVVNRMQNTLAQQGITPPQAPQPTVPSTPEEQEMSDYYDRMYG